MITTTPPTQVSSPRMSKRKAPTAVAVIPRATNTALKPSTKVSPWLNVSQRLAMAAPGVIARLPR